MYNVASSELIQPLNNLYKLFAKWLHVYNAENITKQYHKIFIYLYFYLKEEKNSNKITENCKLFEYT